jgi:hypothetical protein
MIGCLEAFFDEHFFFTVYSVMWVSIPDSALKSGPVSVLGPPRLEPRTGPVLLYSRMSEPQTGPKKTAKNRSKPVLTGPGLNW